MNVGNLRILQNRLRARAGRPFHMGTMFFPEGEPACALGHYFQNRHEASRRINEAGGGLDRIAEREFGLTPMQCGELFSTVGCGRAQTQEEAADYIENFIKRNDPYGHFMTRVFAPKEVDIGTEQVVSETA